MNINDDILKLRDYLLSFDPSELSADGGSVSIRCPYCGDSNKSSTSHHLNILLDTDNNPNFNFPVYHCFLCHAKGAVNAKFLRELNICDDSINRSLQEIANKNRSNVVYKSFSDIDTEYNLEIPNPLLIQRNKIKLDYIRNRIGYNFKSDELQKFKIILDLKEFLKVNDVRVTSCKDYFLDILDKFYIGFLSTHNNFIIMRRVDSFDIDLSKFPRYFNYNIFGKKGARNKFYSIANNLNVLDNGKIDIVMSEGIMDIMSAYVHIFNKDDTKMYISVNGSGYPHTFNYITKRYGIYENHLTILGDRGMFSNQVKLKHLDDMVFYKNIKKNILQNLYDPKISLMFNEFEGEKDFGVPSNKHMVVKTTI